MSNFHCDICGLNFNTGQQYIEHTPIHWKPQLTENQKKELQEAAYESVKRLAENRVNK